MYHVARDYLSVVKDDVLQQKIRHILVPSILIMDHKSANFKKDRACNQLQRRKFVEFS